MYTVYPNRLSQVPVRRRISEGRFTARLAILQILRVADGFHRQADKPPRRESSGGGVDSTHRCAGVQGTAQVPVLNGYLTSSRDRAMLFIPHALRCGILRYTKRVVHYTGWGARR